MARIYASVRLPASGVLQDDSQRIAFSQHSRPEKAAGSAWPCLFRLFRVFHGFSRRFKMKVKNKKSAGRAEVTFLFDVDNTLLDNDHVIEDLRQYLRREVGPERERRYWSIFEQLRSEIGYADYLGALQRYRSEYPRDPNLLMASRFLVNYPFANRLFPNSLDVIDHFKQWGPAVILSDGDVVFQPRKVERSGLSEAVGGNVLIYVHKEKELEDVQQRYPATHYVMVDDQLSILTALKKAWGPRVTTVPSI